MTTKERTMNRTERGDRDTPAAESCGTPRMQGSEQGSALIIAVLITVILSLLGISYMMMAQTENTIAENERNAAMALYVAEAGARMVVNWFNDPSSTGYLVPAVGSVDTTKRLGDWDGDPSTARSIQDGSSGKPKYKQSTGAIFDRLYRGSNVDAFIGCETGTDPDPNNATLGPDLVVNQSHLDTVNDTLFPNFPSPSLRARISRIEVYSPPIVNIGGLPTRMGVATVKVIGGVFIYPGTSQQRQIATRVVKAVVNEIPVPGPVGPLQSCADLTYGGNFEVHWGTASSKTAASLPTSMNAAINSGLPYNPNDPFTYISTPTLASWATTNNTQSIEDPWFKFIAGAGLVGAYNPTMVNSGDAQPWPWSSTAPIAQDHSNLFQNTPTICPTFDYGIWKSIAQSGVKGAYYYKYGGSADQWLLDGTGTATSFVNATANKAGIYFFDTTDSGAPFGNYTDPQYPGPPTAKTGYTNLTPDLSISNADGWLGAVGFVYMNMKSWATTGSGSSGSTHTLLPPGEPGDSSGFVNLDYPGTRTGTYTIKDGTVAAHSFFDPESKSCYCTDAATCTATGSPPSSCSMTAAASPVQDNIGLPFQDNVVLDGVMYNSGTFNAQGNANYFGSLVANQGVTQTSAGTPHFYFDESLIKGGWPRKGMPMPRVIISVWETDL